MSDIEQRLRRDLTTLAGTVTEDLPAPAPTPRRLHRRRRHRLAMGAGALAIPVALAAGAVVRQGPEHVDTIPPERIVATGSVDGSRYLLVETDRRRYFDASGECDEPVTGVELVEERENLLGSEWNTSGYEYGELVERPCGYVNDTSRFLKDPALFTASGSAVGDSFVWVYAVHPDVTVVRVTADGRTSDLVVHAVDGAGYAAYEIPRGVEEWTSELVVDERVVDGSRETRDVPRR